MNETTRGTTTLLQLVESVSEHARDDVETVQVIGNILNRHRFVLANDEARYELFQDRLDSALLKH